MKFYGDIDLNVKGRERLSEVYQTLGDTSFSSPELGDQITLVDLFVVSLVLNNLYGYQPKSPLTNDSQVLRLSETTTNLQRLLEDLETFVQNAKMNIKKRGANDASAEAILNGCSTLVKILTVTTQNLVNILNAIPGQPYSLPSMLKSSLDKAWVKRNASDYKKGTD